VVLQPQAKPEVVSIGNATTGHVMPFQTILAPFVIANSGAARLELWRRQVDTSERTE
jgi:hypothetical protein